MHQRYEKSVTNSPPNSCYVPRCGAQDSIKKLGEIGRSRNSVDDAQIAVGMRRGELLGPSLRMQEEDQSGASSASGRDAWHQRAITAFLWASAGRHSLIREHCKVEQI